MESTETGTSHDEASRIESEIVRMKRELVSEDFKGHSCEQCNGFKMKPLPDHQSHHEEATFFEIDTTEKKVQNLAKSGCRFWGMIQDQIVYRDLEALVEQETDRVSYESEKHGKHWSEEHYKDLAASLGGHLEAEFWRLRRGQRRGGASYGGVAREADFVGVSMGYSQDSWFEGHSLTVDVFVSLLDKRLRKISDPRNDGVYHLDLLPVKLLALRLPADNLATTTRTRIGNPINLVPGSPSTMALIKQWIKKCDVEHGCGISLPPSSMPTLVLDVSNRDRVKLVQVPKAMRERYVALSYCWGKGSPKILLNKATRLNLASGVSLQQLDPTIRDSITVTRQLGFHFLWIDALCIFQDDHESKAKELGRMGDIYRNATFTIVASAAKSVKDGFLVRRKSNLEKAALGPGQPDVVLKMECEGDNRVSNGTSSAILVRKELEKVEPWYERAWTLQEMYFSGRRLQYRTNQTTWTCDCSGKSVQQYDGWVADNTDLSNSDESRIFGRIMEILRKGQSPSCDAKVISTWYEFVEMYSRRKLTYQTDCLPAISAIAKEFGSVLVDQYVCGVWKSELAIGLAWISDSLTPPENTSGSRSAPSWSWASHEGGICWPPGVWWYRNLRQHPDFEVLGITIDLVSASDPFGEVVTANLRIRGLLKPIHFPEMSRRMITNLNLGVYDRVELFFDDANDPRLQPGSRPKLGLLIVLEELLWPEDGYQAAHGLVLLEEKEKRYSRVGYFRIYDKTPLYPLEGDIPFEDAQERERRSPEDPQACIRSLWGGEESIQQIVLV